MRTNTRGKMRRGNTARLSSTGVSPVRRGSTPGFRRGVLLLVVLALLAMFALFAIGFVVIAGQAKRTSLQQQRIEQYYDPFDSLLYQGVLQVLRGPANRASVMGPHSLLEDIYGNTTAPGAVLPGFTSAGGILTLPILPASTGEAPRRVGCVLTMTDGPCRGMSTRIVGFDSANTAFKVLAFDGGALPMVGDSYVVSGTPFSGTGFGYNPFYYAVAGAESQIMLTASIGGTPPILGPPPQPAQNTPLRYALLPNPVPFQQDSALRNQALQYTDAAGPGGANEDYDAPDYQNMILAGATLSGSTLTVVSPSLHRPELVNYWYQRLFNEPTLIGRNSWPSGWTPEDIWKVILQPSNPIYNKNDPQLAADIVQFKRRFMLRPLPDDHPGFNGSNPLSLPDISLWQLPQLQANAWELTGPWDVDTDGDGVPDAIWVDLGFPARPAPNGKMYKPLFAIFCIDLDGRLNLNAHGSLAQALYDPTTQTAPYYQNGNSQSPTSLYMTLFDPSTGILPLNSLNTGYLGLVGNLFADPATGGSPMPPAGVALPRGQGYGPAEINLGPLFGLPSNVAGYTAYQQLLAGGTINGSPLDGRYGESALLGASWVPAPGRTSASVPPAAPNFDPRTDPLGFNKFVDFPDNYLLSLIPGLGAVATIPGTPAVNQTSYGSLPDLKGTLAVGLDPRGQPIYDLLRDPATPGPMSSSPVIPPSAFNFARTNHPYELNLSQKRSRGLPNNSPDNPFSVAEMEGFFRYYDRDAARLPNRLLTLTTPSSGASLLFAHRHEFTTESWSVPVPKTAYPAWLWQQIAPGLGGQPMERLYHPVDLARARLAAAAGLTTPQADQLIPNLLPLEFLAGRKMDLNRPWGNGRDDDGGGGGGVGSVVDEGVGPPFGETDVYWYSDATGTARSTSFSYGGGATLGMEARQLYARHLYVLAQLLIDPQYYPPFLPPGTPQEQAERRARWLAQWAVNVVDFRDRDSIMTRFQYKVDPFTTNGWNIVAADPVVWGCERPELLITEILAIHDRRTEDLRAVGDGYTINHPQYDSNTDKDDDFDQRLMPLGSLFVELFNPWSGVEAASGEFTFDRKPLGLPDPQQQWRGGVLLNQLTPNGHPVWRLVIVNAQDANRDPDEPYDSTQTPLPIERRVYFIDPSALPAAECPSPGTFWSDQPIAPLKHNRYAVIGPGKPTEATSRTVVSRDTDAANTPPKPREIVLTRNVDADGLNQVQVLYNQSATGNNELPGCKPPIAVLVNNPQQRLSVSEPLAGYPATDPDGRPYDPTLGYPTPYDTPFDAGDPILNTEGLTPGYKRIYLQRLANPIVDFNPEANPDPSRPINPYRTIDSMPIDMFAYNGVETHADPSVQTNPVPALEKFFHSRERGDSLRLGTAEDANDVWLPAPYVPPTNAAQFLQLTRAATFHNTDQAETSMTHAYTYVLQQSLGYLNRPFWFVSGDATKTPRTAPAEYLGDLPAGATPFPWLNWNNRPFVSEMELPLVPWARSSQLLGTFDQRTFGLNPTGGDPYKADAIDPAQPDLVVFPHLNNIFFSEPPASGGPGAAASNFYRLLEFVGVPSRFVGTETFGNPGMSGPFAPPFNSISTYREPGRINLNTIPSENVLKGLLNRTDLGSGGLWADFNNSKAGYTSATYQPLLPTRIANPFRSYGGARMVPLPEIYRLLDSTGQGDLARVNDINATLLRPNPNTTSVPLFMTNSQSGSQINNTDRSPFFRYQELQRLANKVTTQSNVYAVWITVGYFEVEPGATDPAHPDGYRLGTELGSDTGEVKRHRGFFIIDRSIPVGFQRGLDLNAERAIVLRRYIE